MNTIKLTHNDLRLMINEAVKRTLAVRSLKEGWYPSRGRASYGIYRENDGPLRDYRGRNKGKYHPYPVDNVWGTRQTPSWYKEFGTKAPFDDTQMRESILEDIEDFKYGIEKVIKKVEKLKAWAAKKNVDSRGLETAFDRHANLGGNMDNTIYSGSEEVKCYVDAKKAATRQSALSVISEYADMTPEERDADIQEYLVPALEEKYRSEYNEYSSDYDKATERRGEVEGALAEFMEKYGDADPKQMSYVELLTAKEDFWAFEHSNNVLNAESFFQERGLDWRSLMDEIGKEIRERYDSVPHFHFCENSTDTPAGKAHYDAEMKKYKKLKAETNAHPIEDRTRHSSSSESIRGYNWSAYELVDDNDELVCTVRFEVDSSD